VIPDLTIRFDILAIGAMAGLGYAVLAAGLVVVYRATKVLNLAHGQIGAFAAVVLIELVHKVGVPYPVAVVAAITSGGLVGLVLERTLVRPLQRRNRLAVLVATIGVIQILLVATILMPKVIGKPFPLPVTVSWEIHGLVIRGEHVALLVLGPLMLLGLGAFLGRSKFGLAIRAVAENRQAAQLAGISTDRVSSMVWVLAGVLAAVAGILTLPLTGGGMGTVAPALGPALLLRALTAGLAGGLNRLPTTIFAGVGIGVVEAVLFASYPTDPGLVDAMLLAAVLVLLLGRSRRSQDPSESIAYGIDVRAMPEHVRRHPVVRRLRRGSLLVVALVALLLPVVYSSSSQLFLLSRVPVYAMIGISIVVLTGWAGQLSLGQMAFAGVGAIGSAALTSRGVPFGAAIAYVTIGGLVLAALVGAPALRLRGLMLTVATLGFAVAGASYFLRLDILKTGPTEIVSVAPGSLGPIDFASYRTTYYACLGALVLTILLALRLRSTGIGRRLLAVEGNEEAAAAMSVSPATTKLTGFAIAGGIATFAGALLAGVLRTFQADVFSPEQSLQVLAMVVVGGIGSVLGAVLGAVYIIGVPAMFDSSATAQLATSGLGLLIVLRFVPTGLVGIVDHGRDRVLRRLGVAIDGVVEPITAPIGEEDARQDRLRGIHARISGTVGHERPAVGPRPLELIGVGVTIEGRMIVGDVDLHLDRGEIVGLIGANGAGKSTLMNAISGFVPMSGSLLFEGEDIGALAPWRRAQLGIGRSFQSATLYPRLSVRECLQVALESQRRSEVVPSLLALPPSIRAERWNRQRADDLLDLLGLGERAEQPISALSTGTRRVVELGCLLAQQPRIVLLDEPMAGIAQRETEAFAPLLLDVRDALGAAVLVIEHDLPLVMSISDRLYCMEAGAVIATGTPDEVRHDPRVVASYLGADERAIARSGALPGA
jgi:ABC-type branched-subunit amino acid transport system ATPase component/ABC-type branched-subunit amino acid transport system permease subunit